MSSIGTNWLGSATRPSVAITAVSPSSSGTPAATSAPKARTRMISVIGSESVSAFLKSSANDFESALLALASPNCADEDARVAGLDRRRPRPRSGRSLRRWSSSPRSLKSTSTERPSLETWPSLPLAYGDSTSETPCLRRDGGDRRRRPPCARPASVALPPLGAWTRTFSYVLLGEVLVDEAGRPCRVAGRCRRSGWPAS